jgi:hypothetical protein
MRADGQYSHDEANNRFRIFANAPKTFTSLILETPNSLKFQMLPIHKTEDSTLQGHAI